MAEARAPTKLPMTLLSVRQGDVLALIASGAGNAEIAATRTIPEVTYRVERDPKRSPRTELRIQEATP